MRRPRFNPWVRKIPWRRAWQPPPGFLPGDSHGQRSLAGYGPWGSRVRHNWATEVFSLHQLILPLSLLECENTVKRNAEQRHCTSNVLQLRLGQISFSHFMPTDVEVNTGLCVQVRLSWHSHNVILTDGTLQWNVQTWGQRHPFWWWNVAQCPKTSSWFSPELPSFVTLNTCG